ncbi:MAG: hypothetical protein MIL41_16845 [Hyphomicrobiales bacterium]
MDGEGVRLHPREARQGWLLGLPVRPAHPVYRPQVRHGAEPERAPSGDVGLANRHILVPYWKNLGLTQQIFRNTYGNLPGGVAARLKREAAGTRAKKTKAGRWGVYWGEVDVGGSRVMGYIARPPHGEAPIGKNGRSIVVNLGRPRVLLGAIPQATYERSSSALTTRPSPSCQHSWKASWATQLSTSPATASQHEGLRLTGAARG